MTTQFDPGGAAHGDGLFGLPHGAEESAVHVIGVPFDATTSYRKGAAHGPAAILAASGQVELFDLTNGHPYASGIYMLPIDPDLEDLNAEASELVEALRHRNPGKGLHPEREALVERIDALGAEVNARVFELAGRILDEGRIIATVGGDHSAPFGAMRACADRHPGMGVFHIDAHADLREAYEGLRWSHASIFYNVATTLDNVERIVQVGVRDLCEEEMDRIEASNDRIQTLFDTDWARARWDGRSLRSLVQETIASLPEEIYVSVDIDGLDPSLCPNTGTPVPGGLHWHETMLWLDELVRSGRRIVGLDLCEVSPGAAGDPRGESWDAVVGARLLYRLIGFALRTR